MAYLCFHMIDKHSVSTQYCGSTMADHDSRGWIVIEIALNCVSMIGTQHTMAAFYPGVLETFCELEGLSWHNRSGLLAFTFADRYISGDKHINQWFL